jgi:hypothetical protein
MRGDDLQSLTLNKEFCVGIMLLRISLVLVMVRELSSCFYFGRHQPLINRQARIVESPSISLEHCVVIRFNPSTPN